MKEIKFSALVAFLAMPLTMVSAQGIADGNITTTPINNLIGNILTFTDTILIPFILGIGFLVFVWGMFQFFIVGGANDDAKEKGKSLMIWAIVGFIMILILWGIVNLIVDSIGLEDALEQTVPSAKTGV